MILYLELVGISEILLIIGLIRISFHIGFNTNFTLEQNRYMLVLYFCMFIPFVNIITSLLFAIIPFKILNVKNDYSKRS